MSNEYLRELTYQLRHRGLDETAVLQIIRELPSQSSEELAAEFGSPATHAGSFPKGKRRTAGSVIISIAAIIAVSAIAWRTVSVFIFHAPQDPLFSIAILGGGVALVAAAAVVAGQVDRRPVRGVA